MKGWQRSLLWKAIKAAADKVDKSDTTIRLNVFYSGREIDLKKIAVDLLKKISKEV